MLFGADSGTQIAWIALIGTLAVPIITGMFGVYVSNRNRQTNEDTAKKITRSTDRLTAFEDMYVQLQREERARKYFEDRSDQQRVVIAQQAARIRELESLQETP